MMLCVACLFCCNFIPLLGLSLTIFLLLGSEHANISSEKSSSLELEWKKPFIESVTLEDEGCPKGTIALIEYDWHGIDHMCIDNSLNYWRGATCEEESLLYVGGKAKTRTTFWDYQGFPMV